MRRVRAKPAKAVIRHQARDAAGEEGRQDLRIFLWILKIIVLLSN